MDSNAILRKIRLVGLYVFFGNTFLQFGYSLMYAFDLFSVLGIPGWSGCMFDVLSMIMITGFGLMFLGSMLQRKVKKKAIHVEELGDSRDFYEHQKQFGEPDPEKKRRKGTRRYCTITFVIFTITATSFMLRNAGEDPAMHYVFETISAGFYSISIAFGAIGVAFLVALIVGNVNEDVWRLYIRGYHVHESVFGIYFAIIGAPLLAGGIHSFQFIIGLAFIVSGVFLVGRDWHDVVRGNILVHFSEEDDYDEYMALKKKRGSILP